MPNTEQAADESSQESKNHSGSGRDFVENQIAGVPLGDLIVAPIIQVAEAQARLCAVYLEHVLKIAYETNESGDIVGGLGGILGGILGGMIGGPAGKEIGSGVGKLVANGNVNKTKVLKFILDRPVTTQDGTVTTQSVEVNAPLLSLIPLPAFTMDKVKVDFTMDVKDQFQTKAGGTTTDIDSKDEKGSNKGNIFSFLTGDAGGNHTTIISGNITSHRESTRTTDNAAKYTVMAQAVQQAPAEGMAKLTALFASIIEPIATNRRDSGKEITNITNNTSKASEGNNSTS